MTQRRVVRRPPARRPDPTPERPPPPPRDAALRWRWALASVVVLVYAGVIVYSVANDQELPEGLAAGVSLVLGALLASGILSGKGK